MSWLVGGTYGQSLSLLYIEMKIPAKSKIEMVLIGHYKFFVKCSLAPGGTLADDMMRTDVCVFAAQEDLETMQAFAQVSKTLHNNFGYLPLSI